MNDLRIEYTNPPAQRYFIIFSAVVFAIAGLYIAIREVLAGLYSMSFYIGVLIAILAVILVLMFTLWRDKPLLIINSEVIETNFKNQKAIPAVNWNSITEMGLGISFIKITTENKSYAIDLASLKYSDLKNAKSCIIEYCESKNIPYHNI